MKRLLACLMMSIIGMPSAFAQTRVLDDFTDASRWEINRTEDVAATAQHDAKGGLCLRYDFGRVSGLATLRRKIDLEFPEHYALTLTLRGAAPTNIFQLKLIDASGENVWWRNWSDYAPPHERTEMLIRQRQVEFAWGPTADRKLKRIAAIELVVGNGREGGKGELCFERLALRTLPPPAPPTDPIATASSTNGSDAAARAVDSDVTTVWRSARGGRQHLQLDLGAVREVAGVMLRWAGDEIARDFDVQYSNDAVRWRTVRQVRNSRRQVAALYLPDGEARHVRIAMRESANGKISRYAVADLKVMDPLRWSSIDKALASLAEASPRGRYPRAYLGQQNYWTLVGVDGGGANSALISEDGAIEPARGGPSLEPFLVEANQLEPITWADVKLRTSLREGYLPIPRVTWTHERATLTIDVGAEGLRDSSRLLARYTVGNPTSTRRKIRLALALRPWQVNPPQQFLTTPGGAVQVEEIGFDKGLMVNGKTWMLPLTGWGLVDSLPFDRDDIIDAGMMSPYQPVMRDPQKLASGVMSWWLDLAPGESRSVDVVLPLSGALDEADHRDIGPRLDAIAEQWRARLNRATITLPPEAQPLVDTLRTSLAHILMSRDGPALRPGTRSYARTWIRDGAMMIAGLLRMGELDASREFVQWYATHLFANGKVPCCVDARGSDPVPENDSHGQFIFSVAELWRYTRDRSLIEPLWPQVDAAARYMEMLRQSERTDANRQPGREAFFGLMPRSISHEGYSASPMHSYWDDFWALAGYRDAVELATVLNKRERVDQLSAQRDEFARELAASLQRVVAEKKIDHLPGAAELGDFDPSSSTMIFSPSGGEKLVPRTLLESTWQRAWNGFETRRDGSTPWRDYTPYELRSVGAFARLGQPDRAHALLDFYMRDRRPPAWNGWAEVVNREPRKPVFVGDMPHAWISSDYMRTVLDLLVYTRESDHALVFGAGIKREWLASGVRVDGLATPYGLVSYELKRDDNTVLLTLGHTLTPPPGGLWFAWPGGDELPVALVDGKPHAWQGRELRIPDGSKQLTLQFP